MIFPIADAWPTSSGCCCGDATGPSRAALLGRPIGLVGAPRATRSSPPSCSPCWRVAVVALLDPAPGATWSRRRDDAGPGGWRPSLGLARRCRAVGVQLTATVVDRTGLSPPAGRTDAALPLYALPDDGSPVERPGRGATTTGDDVTMTHRSSRAGRARSTNGIDVYRDRVSDMGAGRLRRVPAREERTGPSVTAPSAAFGEGRHVAPPRPRGSSKDPLSRSVQTLVRARTVRTSASLALTWNGRLARDPGAAWPFRRSGGDVGSSSPAADGALRLSLLAAPRLPAPVRGAPALPLPLPAGLHGAGRCDGRGRGRSPAS